jgi:PAS domain S-box-containing protein
MRRRLYKGALTMIILVLVVLGGNQLIIGLFSRISEKLILENHELFALEEMKGALGKILIEESQYLVSQADIISSLENAETKLIVCREELSHVHTGESWGKVELMFKAVSENIDLLMRIPPDNGALQHVISHQILDLIAEVETLVNETVHEINEYEIKSHKVKLHGTLTVVVLGTSLIIFLLIWSFRFIRELTRPIEQLVHATQKIEDGNRDLRVEVDSQDEFKLLADSFNSMLDALVQTSISEKYLNNILNNLYGALLVTDAEARIQSINSTTSHMLKYSKNELLGENILLLFNSENSPGSLRSVKNLHEQSKMIGKQSIMLDKDGLAIPVYVTSVVLRNGEGEAEGMVVVGHDLTEEKKNEAKIENLRKERTIAVHEAQELERLRISRDLHDGLGQLLTGISYSVQKIGEGNTIDRDFADRLQTQVNTAIQETKNLAQDLAPIVLKDFGLPAAIESLVQRTNQLQKTRFIFNSYSFSERIDAKLEKALFRICQEAVNNIIKHSSAKEASIELYRVEDMIVLVMEDDGMGFDTDKLVQKESSKGLGLISMQERVVSFSGDFAISSKPGRGTEIVIEIPCRKRKNNGDH